METGTGTALQLRRRMAPVSTRKKEKTLRLVFFDFEGATKSLFLLLFVGCIFGWLVGCFILVSLLRGEKMGGGEGC